MSRDDEGPILIPEQLRCIEEALRQGVPRPRALRASGVGRRQYQAMMRLGGLGREPYVSVLQGWEEAEAQGEAALVANIGESPDWRAKAWLLERTRPETYSQRVQLDVTRELERVFGVLERILPARTFDQVLDALACADGDERGAGVEGEAAGPAAQLN